MHDTAYQNAKEFINKYVPKGSYVLEIGSQDVNGKLKSLFDACYYTGIDVVEGENVDIVANSHYLPFDSPIFDVIISSSNFEHDVCFWQTFKEMCRVLKPGGVIYICAPSSGPYHAYPYDCWRFYSDAGKALKYWINNFTEYKITLLEHSIKEEGIWQDNIMIFKKHVKDRIDIINYLIKKKSYTNYVEIGCDNNECFDKINIEAKIGIDPFKGGTERITSDNFFENRSEKEKIDLIFIDGLHVKSQIALDIFNSLKFLSEQGTIVCHDINPTSKIMQSVPRLNVEWTGDVWKEWINLRMTRSDLEMYVVDVDYGVGIIKIGKQELLKIEEEIDYETFSLNREKWLNLISVEDFLLK